LKNDSTIFLKTKDFKNKMIHNIVLTNVFNKLFHLHLFISMLIHFYW
jgi:hypothetical protein